MIVVVHLDVRAAAAALQPLVENYEHYLVERIATTTCLAQRSNQTNLTRRAESHLWRETNAS